MKTNVLIDVSYPPLMPRKIPCRSCIAMVPCALLIENRGGGYQHWPLYAWSFAQWRQFVVYKAEAAGMDVVAIDPYYMWQTCSHCELTCWGNQCSQALFQCRHCGYTLHADLNAAQNIAPKYRASRDISSAVRHCQPAYRPLCHVLYHVRRGIRCLL